MAEHHEADEGVQESSILDGESDDAREREGQARDRRNVRRVLAVVGITMAVVLVAVLAIGGWYASRVDNALNRIKRDPSMMPTGDTTAVAPKPADKDYKQPMVFVLMGSDSRGPDQGRSDVLMTAYLPGNRKQVYLTSYPRDLWVPIPGHGEAKINAAYAFGGTSLTVATLQNYTGVKVDHIAMINFERFIQLTEALGGVTVNNQVASTSGDGKYTWPRGQITVSGAEALAYVRQRKELPNGDFDRAERQRAVVTAIIAKMASADVLTNPVKFDRMATKVADTVTVDDGLSDSKMRDVAFSMRVKGKGDVVSFQAPISGFGTSRDGQWIALPDKAGQAELSAAMKNDTMAEFWAKNKNNCKFAASGC